MDEAKSIHHIPVALELTYDEFIAISMALATERHLVRGTKTAEAIEALEKKIDAQYAMQFWNRNRTTES